MCECKLFNHGDKQKRTNLKIKRKQQNQQTCVNPQACIDGTSSLP